MQQPPSSTIHSDGAGADVPAVTQQVKRPAMGCVSVPRFHIGVPSPRHGHPCDAHPTTTHGKDLPRPSIGRSTLAGLPAEIVASFLLYLPASCVLGEASRTCRGWLSVVRRHPELRGHGALCGLHILGGVSYSMGPAVAAVAPAATHPLSRSHGASDWATQLPPMLRERMHCAAATVNRCIYVVGGRSAAGERFQSAEVFDPAVRAWGTLPPMTHARSGAAAVGHGGRLWVFGGTDGAGDVCTVATFDPTKGAWSDSAVPAMPHPASEVAATVWGRVILVVGGRQRDGTALDVVRCLDPTQRTWSELPPMTSARAGPAVGVVDGTLWVAGGADKRRAPLATTEALVLPAGGGATAPLSWALGPPMNTPRSNPAGVVVCGQFRVMCGFCFGPLSTAEALCPTTRRWKRCKDVPRKFDAAKAVVWE